MTVEEYLKFEESTAIKHEYVAGELFAMSGASLRHNVIVDNIGAAFRAHLRGGPCRWFSSDAKLRLKANHDDIIYYPDAMVVCGKVDMDGSTVQDPRLVVEVLSPSTARTDRSEKALNYRQIPSLEEYVLIAQDRTEVTIFRRQEIWRPQVSSTPESVLELRSIGLSLPLADLYEATASATADASSSLP